MVTALEIKTLILCRFSKKNISQRLKPRWATVFGSFFKKNWIGQRAKFSLSKVASCLKAKVNDMCNVHNPGCDWASTYISFTCHIPQKIQSILYGPLRRVGSLNAMHYKL
jgi:hypothetical protein